MNKFVFVKVPDLHRTKIGARITDGPMLDVRVFDDDFDENRDSIFDKSDAMCYIEVVAAKPIMDAIREAIIVFNATHTPKILLDKDEC